MQSRNYWTEELLRWSRQNAEKKTGSITDIKKQFSGQETISADSAAQPSREIQEITKTGKIEEYEIIEKLGQGADAAVFKARKNEQEYIIKAPLTDRESKTRLKNEMDTSIKISWLTKKTMNKGWAQAPHIIQMLDCRKGDLTFAVLEMLEKQIERTHKKTGDTRFIRIAALEAAANEGQHGTRTALYAWDTMHAIEFIHSMDIVHRDIKYQNSMASHRKGKLASVLFDLGTALDLTDEENIKKAGIAGTPIYMPKSLVTDFWKYKDNGGFYTNCPANRIKAILKRGDYGSLAHSIAHLLTGIPPYSNKKEGKNTSIFDTCSSNAEYIYAILNFQGNPIDLDKIKEQQEGKMFADIIEKLLNPLIVSKGEIDQVYEILEKGMKMEGLFTRYKIRD